MQISIIKLFLCNRPSPRSTVLFRSCVRSYDPVTSVFTQLVLNCISPLSPVSDPHPVSRRSSLPGTRALPVLSDTRPQEGTTLGGVRRWDPHFPSQWGSWRSPDWLEKKTECRSARLVRFWQITGVSRIFKSSQRYV